MNIEPRTPSVKNPPEHFVGDVWLDILASPNDPDQRATLARVRFAPGARTAWHSHARGQYLHVTQGVAIFGGRDGSVIEVHAGQTLYTPPGEDHWHASAHGCYMEHLALFEAAENPDESTVWKEHVREAEFLQATSGL